jgi:hypothetical protein
MEEVDRGGWTEWDRERICVRAGAGEGGGETVRESEPQNPQNPQNPCTI